MDRKLKLSTKESSKTGNSMAKAKLNTSMVINMKANSIRVRNMETASIPITMVMSTKGDFSTMRKVIAIVL